MSDISLRIAIKEESSHLFKRCVRKLLEATFILRDKEEKLYQFVSRESNRQDISEYLRMIGFDVVVEEKTGVCMLVASEEDADTVGLGIPIEGTEKVFYRVRNYEPGELPFSGNIGTRLFLVMGGVLMAVGISGGVWWYVNRRKRAGGSP